MYFWALGTRKHASELRPRRLLLIRRSREARLGKEPHVGYGRSQANRKPFVRMSYFRLGLDIPLEQTLGLHDFAGASTC